jgi:hypothetical protein
LFLLARIGANPNSEPSINTNKILISIQFCLTPRLNPLLTRGEIRQLFQAVRIATSLEVSFILLYPRPPMHESHETHSCELCGRRVSLLTRHHLIPRTRHANKRNKREFERKEVKQRIAWLCIACHDHLHALFGEKTLEREYNTLGSITAHPEVQRFLAWIRKKPADFRPASHDAGNKN